MATKISSYCSVPLILFYVMVVCGCTRALAPESVQSPPFTDWISTCIDWDEWDKPGPPFRIFGNSYYVGTCGISAILVTSNKGHILIDGGTEAGADIIAQNIQTLGFALNDVKILLHSHEHFDHVAGLARLQQLSGARLLASVEAAPVLRTGISADTDPQVGVHEAFPAAQVHGTVREGTAVNLGTVSLNPIETPGHTPGALSWQWESCEGDHCLSVVYADSLSPVSNDSYRFSDHPTYLASYRAGLGKLASLDCSILLTTHPSLSNMRERLLKDEGLVDREACNTFAEETSLRLNQRLSIEIQGQKP